MLSKFLQPWNVLWESFTLAKEVSLSLLKEDSLFQPATVCGPQSKSCKKHFLKSFKTERERENDLVSRPALVEHSLPVCLIQCNLLHTPRLINYWSGCLPVVARTMCLTSTLSVSINYWFLIIFNQRVRFLLTFFFLGNHLRCQREHEVELGNCTLETVRDGEFEYQDSLKFTNFGLKTVNRFKRFHKLECSRIWEQELCQPKRLRKLRNSKRFAGLRSQNSIKSFDSTVLIQPSWFKTFGEIATNRDDSLEEEESKN